MKYLTGYVWQAPQSEGTQKAFRESSILLQEVSYGRCNVVLACVIGGGVVGGYVASGLKAWLMDRGKALFGKKVEERMVQKEIEKVLERLYAEGRRYMLREKDDNHVPVSLSGILIADQDCWVIQGEESSLFILNRRFQRTHCKEIGNTGNTFFTVNVGRIQKCVGVLLGNRRFLQSVSGEAVKQCLAAQDIVREEQIALRLKELAEESRRQKYSEECSAVYLRST